MSYWRFTVTDKDVENMRGQLEASKKRCAAALAEMRKPIPAERILYTVEWEGLLAIVYVRPEESVRPSL